MTLATHMTFKKYVNTIVIYSRWNEVVFAGFFKGQEVKNLSSFWGHIDVITGPDINMANSPKFEARTGWDWAHLKWPIEVGWVARLYQTRFQTFRF